MFSVSKQQKLEKFSITKSIDDLIIKLLITFIQEPERGFNLIYGRTSLKYKILNYGSQEHNGINKNIYFFQIQN